jgi:DNA repair protein RecN (Recombination protein N)
LYGGRASSDVVRTGSDRARVTGIFEAPRNAAFRALAESAGIDLEEGELLVGREIQANGKSRAFVGNRPVTAALLREMSPYLGDIHGQHDQQELFSADAQLAMLDHFAGSEMSEIADLSEKLRELDAAIAEIDRNDQEKLRLADMWSFQKREIEQAQLQAGEEEQLHTERSRLANVARLEEHSRAAGELLYESEYAALGAVRQARRRLEELCRIDPALNDTLASLLPAEIAIDEAARVLQSYAAGLEADPARLDHIEARLAVIERLKRKYGESVEVVLAFLEDVSQKLDGIETAGQRRERLIRDREAAAAAYQRAANKLSDHRKASARLLEKAIHAELASLAMAGTVFQVDLTKGDWTARGWDQIRFLVSPNKGEEPRSLEKVASGGELSRLALALKTSLAGREERASATGRTLVFDEVDAGIGGRTAESVGRRLKKLSAANQVLCVTHAPQIAGFADHHYVVSKSEAGGRTVTAIEELVTSSQRAREIGRMLSGERMTEDAIRHAEQLIKEGSRS